MATENDSMVSGGSMCGNGSMTSGPNQNYNNYNQGSMVSGGGMIPPYQQNQGSMFGYNQPMQQQPQQQKKKKSGILFKIILLFVLGFVGLEIYSTPGKTIPDKLVNFVGNLSTDLSKFQNSSKE